MNQGSNDVLRRWLGESFDVLMSCRVERLPELDQNGGTMGFSRALGELSPADVNSRSGRKRLHDDEESPMEDVKRLRSGKVLSDTIDLT